MGGALDQFTLIIQKLVFLPFQRDVQVGAAVQVGIQLAVLEHGEPAFTAIGEAQALTLCQVTQGKQPLCQR